MADFRAEKPAVLFNAERPENYLNKRELRELGFSDKMVRELVGHPEEIREYYSPYLLRVHYYNADRIRRIMATPRFKELKEKYDKARARTAKARMTRTKKALMQTQDFARRHGEKMANLAQECIDAQQILTLNDARK